VVTPVAERRAVAHLKETFGMSERRACKAIGCCRTTVRYESTRPDDRDLRERMKAIAHERRRFGYRRVHILLKREGYLVNHKKLFRSSVRRSWRSAAAAPASEQSAPERR
jgi:putative transposase